MKDKSKKRDIDLIACQRPHSELETSRSPHCSYATIDQSGVSARVLRRRARCRRGATAVEFALIFPLLLIFFISSMAFTQAFMLRDTAQHAAYKGVRRGIVWNATTADVVAEVEGFLSQLGIRGAVIVTDPPTLDNSVKTIRVDVSIPMNSNAWIASPLMPAGFSPASSVSLNRPSDQ